MQAAQKYDVQCLAVTDHDTVEGVAPCQALAAEYDVDIIPGIELSAEENRRDVHILGYFLNIEDSRLLDRIRRFQEARVARIKKMIEKLAELGVTGIDFSEVAALTRSNSVGRMHLALVLAQKGLVYDIKEAFDKYIGEDGPAYVPKWKFTPIEAIQLIKDVGGVAVLAHPMVTSCDEIIPSLVKSGLGGMEVFYPNSSSEAIRFYSKLAQKHNLVATGGSDSHGRVKPATHIGTVKVPCEVVEELRRRAAQG